MIFIPDIIAEIVDSLRETGLYNSVTNNGNNTFTVNVSNNLSKDEWIEIIWTISAPEDENFTGKTARRRFRIQRLLVEATNQGAVPTVNDLATTLDSSPRTIKRDLSALREAGIPIQTRGSRIT